MDYTKIIYEFGDASVPPPHHRSYKITLDAKKADIVVDSYGDILAEKSYEISQEQFGHIAAAIAKHGIKACELPENEGCTGGTSRLVSAFNDKGKVFSGRVYQCGGSNSGSLCGDVRAFSLEVKALIPDINDLLQ